MINLDVIKKRKTKDIIKNLAITKQLNFLIGSGVSKPAISLMKNVSGKDEKEKNENLVKEIKEVSRKILEEDFSDKEVEKTYRNYYKFLFQVIQLLNMSNSRQVPRSVNLFTTNYDLFIEKAIDKLSIENRFIFNDGANGYFKRYIDSANYNRVVSYKGLNDNYINEIPSINLIKPHGSVNWKQENEKILVNNNVEDDCVVVKPTGIEGQETFLNNYFHDMLRMFQLELDKPQSVLFVIGFSFQDKHIAKMFKRALQNCELLAYIFCFSDKDIETILKNLDLEDGINNLRILSPKDFDNSILEENKDKDDDKKIWYSFTINSLTNIFEGIQDDR